MATSYVAANGRKLEFRVKKCGNISKDSASGISLDEFQLQRRVSKKKFKTVLTLVSFFNDCYFFLQVQFFAFLCCCKTFLGGFMWSRLH